MLKEEQGKTVTKAHPLNVPGPFCVEDGCCITCGVPEDIAPDMFGWAPDPHCFVKQQPCNPDQLDRILQAMWSSEVSCIRYRGDDARIARRIAEFGLAECCDEPPADASVIVRTLVRFRSPLSGAPPSAAADRFRAWLAGVEGYAGPRYKIRKPRWWNPGTVKFTWEAEMNRFPAYNSVHFFDDEDGMLWARTQSGRSVAAHGLALTLQDWLLTVEGVSDIRWFSWNERDRGEPGLHMPI